MRYESKFYKLILLKIRSNPEKETKPPTYVDFVQKNKENQLFIDALKVSVKFNFSKKKTIKSQENDLNYNNPYSVFENDLLLDNTIDILSRWSNDEDYYEIDKQNSYYGKNHNFQQLKDE